MECLGRTIGIECFVFSYFLFGVALFTVQSLVTKC